ncbi:MAG: monovalent cation/H+ antiporter subunit A [Rhodocyclaceae bacterium]|nr:monovalent cation/H+ antiporter subunit A [Rhodocyclaceae bacterium]
MPDDLIAFFVALPFAAAALAGSVRSRRLAAMITGLTAFTVLLGALALAPAVFGGEVLRWQIAWLDAPSIAFGFRIDGLAWLFIALIGGIGMLVVLYASYYLDASEPAPRFYAMLAGFMGAMLGVVTADNLLLLVIFWELTSLSSFLLIGFWRHRQDARQGARMALAITGAGGLCLFAGVMLIGHIVGSFALDDVLAARDLLQAHPAFPAALGLVLLGAFTKSAQFPFHFWLPHAMAAPTPVSAYLHSATMVKAGVFLLARLYPALAGNEMWFWIVSTAGMATLLLGSAVAIFQHDVKGLLAYSTISHLGLITLLLGLDSPLAAVAAVFHIMNHATFKASLFMAAGIVDHECGTRDMRRINGLWRFMPVTATLAMTAAAAMAGVPLLNGFISKEMFFAETLFVEGHRLLEFLTPAAATLAGAFAIAYSLRFAHDVFFNGEPEDLPRTPHEPPLWMRVPVALLVALCLVVGLAPDLAVGRILNVAAGPLLPQGLPDYDLAIWHGFNLPLAMSVLAMVVGAVLYFSLQRLFRLHQRLMQAHGKRAFDTVLSRFGRFADEVSRFRNGSLQRYVALLLAVILVAGATPFLVGPYRLGTLAPAWPDPFELTLWAIGVGAAVGTVVAHRARSTALVFVGAVGVVVALTFEHLSAPDLMLTQLLVEVVTIVLMMLALHHLPQWSRPDPRPVRMPRLVRDVALAVAAGGGAALLAFAVLTRAPAGHFPRESLADFFLTRAVPEGGGTNAVNVILVDFRGFDTFGEVTVLAIAALTIVALLRHLHPPPASVTHPEAADPVRHPLLLRVVARTLLPMAWVVALFLFLRGHNLPGGGFIAGLVYAIGLVTLYLAFGRQHVEARLSSDWQGWLGWGLLIAAATGAGAMVLGYPFLTSTFGHPVLPLIGELPLASAALFDLGVFAVVVGGSLAAIVALGRLRAVGDGSVPVRGEH